MTTKHQPATPLPWRLTPCGADCNCTNAELQNDAFVLHAANAYPRLVEGMERVARLAEAIDRAGDDAVPESLRGATAAQIYAEARAILRELGEEGE